MLDIDNIISLQAGWWVLEGWVLGSRQVSLWLAVSVLTVSLGIGTMTLALVRRHRLAIETALYGSIGSLRRLRGKKRSNSGAKPSNSGEEASNSNSNSSNLTTATEVAFFPRYSVVNKSWREEKSGKKKKNEEKEKDNGKPVKDEGKTAVAVTEEAEQQKEPSKRVESAASNKSRSSSKQRSVKEVVADSKQSLYEIISTIKFKSQQSAPASKAREPQQRRTVEPHQTSFYFQGGNQSSGSSKYDLTLARTLSKKVI